MVQVMFDNSQPQDGELHVSKGARLELIKMMEDGWLQVRDSSMSGSRLISHMRASNHTIIWCFCRK